MKSLFLGYSVTLSFLLLTVAPKRLERLVPEIRGAVRIAAPGAHLVSFAVLAFVSWIALSGVPRWLVVFGLIGFAVLTEAFQVFVPGRCCDVIDLWHNLAGLTVGMGLGLLLRARAHSRSPNTPVSPRADLPNATGTAS